MRFIFVLGLFIKVHLCDWVSEWLAPIEYQYKDVLTNNMNGSFKLLPEDDNSEIIQRNLQSRHINTNNKIYKLSSEVEDFRSPENLKIKLEESLKTTETLAISLKQLIKEIETKERVLKEAIVNGRSGVTTLTVSLLGQVPRIYIIRDGYWTLCNGIIQYPTSQSSYIFTELFSTPRCIGQEIASKRDLCVYNSIIKYETVPERRRSTYFEDDYLCLRGTFNNTLEKFMSVTKKQTDETCKNGVIRSLTDNIQDCGVRVVSEYTYYPQNFDAPSTLPLEYCTENDGSCKLIVAWHLSNKTIENFAFLKSDQNFKKFFIKSDSNMESFI